VGHPITADNLAARCGEFALSFDPAETIDRNHRGIELDLASAAEACRLDLELVGVALDRSLILFEDALEEANWSSEEPVDIGTLVADLRSHSEAWAANIMAKAERMRRLGALGPGSSTTWSSERIARACLSQALVDAQAGNRCELKATLGELDEVRQDWLEARDAVLVSYTTRIELVNL
jgi:hypothetical protein